MSKQSIDKNPTEQESQVNQEKMIGADIIIASLLEENVECIFGYPGGAVLEIYDALARFTKKESFKNFKHILVRHEQAAVHAADAYSRSSNKVGVALVTSGPGATNAITGIATAFSDSIPIVVISGQVPSSVIGTDAFQEVDMIGCSRPIVKHNFLVKNVNNLSTTIKKAFKIAKSGRPGPVVIDIPKDITIKEAKFHYPKDIKIPSYQPNTQAHPGQVKRAAKLLTKALRPLIYVGGGAVLSNSYEQIRKLIDMLNLPYVSTIMGIGVLDTNDSRCLGMLGMHGTFEANLAMQNCDVLLAVGARFDDRVISVPKDFLDAKKKIIHIDIDPSSINKRVKVDVPIVADVSSTINDIINALQKNNNHNNLNPLDDWWRQINIWRSHECLYYKNSNDVIKPQYVLDTLSKITNGNAIVTSDVGQHQMWVAQYYKFNRPKQWINSAGLGTMGFGLPAAMGAYFANPNAQIACVTGDGSIQMNIQELSTCKQYDIPIKIISLNNKFLGMVRQWQEFFYETRYSHTYMSSLPDFVKLAQAYGHIGFCIEKTSDVEPILKEAFSKKLKNKLVFIDFIVESESNVFPMIQNGKGLNEMDLPAHMKGVSQTIDKNI